MENVATNDLACALEQFTGSDEVHRLNRFCPWLLATDGVKYLCETAGAYWLFDAIASHQSCCRHDEMLQQIQFWELDVDLETKKAWLTCYRDENDQAIRQRIQFTDFPLPKIKIWVEGQWGQQMIAMLPSER